MKFISSKLFFYLNIIRKRDPEEEIMNFIQEVHRDITNEWIEEPMDYEVGGFIDDEYPPLIGNIAPSISSANLTTNVTKVSKISNEEVLIQINKLKRN